MKPLCPSITSRAALETWSLSPGPRVLGLLALAALGGCCTSARCLERHSSPDRERVQAVNVKLGVVHNDRVSSPARDRTDWKFVDLPKPGKLSVQLHWDTGQARLELTVFDVLGVKVQDGRPWGSGGLRAAVAVEEPGRYYVRVRASGKRDETAYSLRLEFTPDRPAAQCQSCSPGEHRCLGSDAYLTCEQVSRDCNAWSRSVSCAPGIACREGQCETCAESCTPGQRRCRDGTHVEICRAEEAACPAWVSASTCAGEERCRGAGQCVRPRRGGGARAEPAPASDRARARIISIYRYRGRMTLHIEIGDSTSIKAGQVGRVLEGTGSTALAGGEIRISKVAGRFAIATTNLETLGNNRWVEIQLR
ncbi:MAG: hypothetical protein IPL40_06200 [Proteobacteria bacterium]|nr:hypothetical protein [Pseudomonadota bacterium]